MLASMPLILTKRTQEEIMVFEKKHKASLREMRERLKDLEQIASQAKKTTAEETALLGF